jgi:hypothetical protein
MTRITMLGLVVFHGHEGVHGGEWKDVKAKDSEPVIYIRTTEPMPSDMPYIKAGGEAYYSVPGWTLLGIWSPI